jgi:hypothetical protein
MEGEWESLTPRGMARFTMRGSLQGGFMYTARLTGDNVVHTFHGVRLSRIEIEEWFAEALDSTRFKVAGKNAMVERKKKIEVFSAGCSVCKQAIEMVWRIAGRHEVVIHDMHKFDAAVRAAAFHIRSIPAIVIDGKLADCSAGRGPDERLLRLLLD